MRNAIESYRDNVLRVRNLGGINRALTKIVTSAIDLSDILRAQHVLAVSALDYFVHEATRIGMLEVFDGNRPPTPAFSRFRISLDALGPGAVVSRSNFENEIRAQHSFLSFQHPDKVADALRLIADIKLWDAVGAELNNDPLIIKQRLRLIVDRRNKIAHEADVDPTYPNVRWPISESDVDGTIDFLSETVEAIYTVLL
jgi:RiboL-PSP-HEPN